MRKSVGFILVLMATSLAVCGNTSKEVVSHFDGYGIQMDMDDAVATVCDCPEVSSVGYTNLSNGTLVYADAHLVEYSSMVIDVGNRNADYVEKYNLPLPYY